MISPIGSVSTTSATDIAQQFLNAMLKQEQQDELIAQQAEAGLNASTTDQTNNN